MLQAVLTPGSLPEAHQVMAGRDGVRIIAGGTAIMPMLNGGTDDFTSLVSLRKPVSPAFPSRTMSPRSERRPCSRTSRKKRRSASCARLST